MTKSPVSTWLANCGFCLPRSRRAACEASRPRTMSFASMTCQERSTSPGFGEEVDTVQLSRSVFPRTGPGRERYAFSSGPCAPTVTFRLTTACTPGHGRDVRWVARQRRTLPTSPPAGQIRGRPGAGGWVGPGSAGADDAGLVEHRFAGLVHPAV